MSTRSTGFATSTSTPPTHQYQTLYIIVFGFPPARASVTMAHFQSLSSGGTTEPESLADVENAFKIGYKQPWEAARAVRKNGEVVSGDAGRWMVGVKWVVSKNYGCMQFLLPRKIDFYCSGRATCGTSLGCGCKVWLLSGSVDHIGLVNVIYGRRAHGYEFAFSRSDILTITAH